MTNVNPSNLSTDVVPDGEGHKLCTNFRHLNRERLENPVLKMLSEVVLNEGHLEELSEKSIIGIGANEKKN